MDLFTQARGDLVGAERPKAVELLQALPAEASSKSTNAQEAGMRLRTTLSSESNFGQLQAE
jgi:hypothetical protein